MDFIPKVKMNFDPDEVMDLETEEENPQFVYDDNETQSGEEIVEVNDAKSQFIPKPSKNEIFEEEIFHDIPKKVKARKSIVEEVQKEEAFAKQEEEKPPTKEKEKKKRKPMTEEHKAKLKLAREKAYQARLVNSEARKKDKAMEKEEKELLKLKKVKDLQKLKKSVMEEEEPKVVIKKEKQLTKEDLQEAQLQAIMKYEYLRKERKEVKKKAQEEAEHNQKVRAKLMNARNPRNKFGSSYSGM
tara:strand:- start:202 stop:930 length:729 start_codon:yes stop_codon:yes gene_type:complete